MRRANSDWFIPSSFALASARSMTRSFMRRNVHSSCACVLHDALTSLLNVVFNRGMNTNGLDKAIEAVGGPAKLAAAIGVKPQVVTNWRSRGVPAEQCPAIERATRDVGKPVLCEELRPDVAWGVLREQATGAAASH